MAESTLNLAVSEIQAKLGTFAGWGRGALYGDDAWGSTRQAIIDDATQSGLRRFYYPEPAEGESQTYDWSFLRPTSNLSLPVGAQTIALPDDFQSAEGPLTVLTSTTTSMPFLIRWINAGLLRQKYSMTPIISGPPLYAAIDPLRGTTGTQSSRTQLLIYPMADQDYTLQCTYVINPDYLTGAAPYAYGGPEHAETILESCLAVMEKRLDDMSGVHSEEFGRRLMASIGMDRKKKPQRYGENRDRSDGRGFRQGDQHWWTGASTYNGVGFD